MGKGSKLKSLFTRQKAVEAAEKKEKISKENKKASLQKDEESPKVITKEDLDKAEELANEEAQEAMAEVDEEYKSKSLSRKDKRKLKKQLKKQQPEKAESGDEEAEEEVAQLDLGKLARSDSESDDEDEEAAEDAEDLKSGQEEEEEEEEEEDVPLSDVEFDSDADVVPHQRLTINNSKAMKEALARIQLPWAKHSFQESQAVTADANCDENIKDIYDDTERELAFYKQSLSAVLEARQKLKALKVPFKRPLDYFAEMVKSDEHMDKLKTKLVKEASEKKAREEARKQRQLKKFGKQVQVATLQQRQKEKRETLDKIKSLKKKRKHNEIADTDFDIGVEEATAEKSQKSNGKRIAKNAKYGQGGMKRFKRKNDAQSSAEMSEFSQRKMKGKAPRPGKSKRSRRH